MSQAMPTIEEVVAKFSPGAAAAPVDESTGKGGTTSSMEAAVAPVEATEAVETPTEPVVEVTEAPKEEPKRDISASRFAALARREKEARTREQAADQRVKEAEARSKALEERDSKWSRIKQNPLDAIKEAGLSLTDVLNAAYGNYKAPEVDPIDAKLQPLLDKSTKAETQAGMLLKQVEELRNQLAMKEQAEQYDKVMGQIKDIAKDTDKYELINTFGDEALDLVRDVMVEYWKSNEKMLDYSEACDIVEKHYEDSYVSKLSKTKKLQSRLGTQPAATKPAPIPQKPKEPSSTLSNKMATTPQVNNDLDKMSKREAIEYLSKKLQFT